MEREGEGGELLDELLDDFLRYGGKIELDKRPVDLNRLCEDLVDFFHPQAQLQRVQLRLPLDPVGGHDDPTGQARDVEPVGGRLGVDLFLLLCQQVEGLHNRGMQPARSRDDFRDAIAVQVAVGGSSAAVDRGRP